MGETIIRTGGSKAFHTRERCVIREIANSPAITEFSLAEARVEAGVTTELHCLGVDEWYVISRGTGRVEVNGGEPLEVGPGDIVVIPAGEAQRITNDGDGDLVFTCVCQPRFTADCYEPLEDQ